MKARVDSWAEEAARRPVGFAQVREDAELDLAMARRAGPRASVVMVASGGCTAAALAGSPHVARIHLVDPNPSQVALCRLKLRWLQSREIRERLELLGHEPMNSGIRSRIVAAELESLGLPPRILGPLEFVGRFGPDFIGRYERVFEQLRRRLAFRETMSLPNLVALFGTAATANRRMPFSEHFRVQTRRALARWTVSENPYLSQMLRGRFDGARTPWLCAPRRTVLPRISWAVEDMQSALHRAEREFDLVHLSNILDWCSPQEARTTLRLARRALRPGGRLIVRQLNSTLRIPELGEGIEWDRIAGREFRRRDRSFFYRKIHVGRKR